SWGEPVSTTGHTGFGGRNGGAGFGDGVSVPGHDGSGLRDAGLGCGGAMAGELRQAGGGSGAPSAASDARAFSRVSVYSSSTSDMMVIAPPTPMLTSSPSQTMVRMTMLRSAVPL